MVTVLLQELQKLRGLTFQFRVMLESPVRSRLIFTGGLENMSKNKGNSSFATGVALGGFFGGVVFSAFLFSGLLHVDEQSGFNLDFDAATTITIVLTALSIMLTALGIIIAVVGAFGFSMLRTAAVESAANHAADQLGERGELRKLIEARVNSLVAEMQKGGFTNLDLPNPESEYGE